MHRTSRPLSILLLVLAANGCSSSPSAKPVPDGGNEDGGGGAAGDGSHDSGQPAAEDAGTANDAGRDSGAAVVTYSVGGEVSGLSAAGLVLRDDGGDDLPLAAGTLKFKFAKQLPDSAPYGVTVKHQPAGLSCVVAHGHGRIMAAKVTAVQVTCTALPLNFWTWVGGSQATDTAASYGTLGNATTTNDPGARYGSAAWTGNGDSLWLFGGTPDGGSSELNDLWKFDGSNWTWIAGANTTDASGTYGTQGTADTNNTPGGRHFMSSAKDASGNLWLFGGYGWDSGSTRGPLNDLWKFDGSAWTWMSGSKTGGSAAMYGTQHTAASGNIPGARSRALMWIDSSGEVWLFGGRDQNGHLLNDLWRFASGEWTWMSGSNTTDASGVYGTQGTANANNTPGARQDSVAWLDANDHLWLFGGYGYDSAGTESDLGELWKFNGSTWTWISGSKIGDTAASYGMLGKSVAANDPGARENAVSWLDAQGNLWLMAGTSGHDSPELNDLWKFDGTYWTWISGADTADAVGTYGSLGTASADNVPGGRDSAAAWITGNGELWLFGGWGRGASGNASNMNDLWHYQP